MRSFAAVYDAHDKDRAFLIFRDLDDPADQWYLESVITSNGDANDKAIRYANGLNEQQRRFDS